MAEQTEEMQRAIDYLEKHWPEGNKERGEAWSLLALGQIGGRSEMKIINSRQRNDRKICSGETSPGTSNQDHIPADSQEERL